MKMLALLWPLIAALAVSPSIALPTTESDGLETNAISKALSDTRSPVKATAARPSETFLTSPMHCTAVQNDDQALYTVNVMEPYTLGSGCKKVFQRLKERMYHGLFTCVSDGVGGAVMSIVIESGHDDLVNEILDDEYHDMVLSNGGVGFDCSSESQALSRRQASEPPVPDLDMTCHTYEGFYPNQRQHLITIGLPWDPATSCRNVSEEARLSDKLYGADCDETDNNQTAWLLLTHVDDVEWFMKILDEQYPDIVKHRNGQPFRCPAQPDRAIARREEDVPLPYLDLNCHSNETWSYHELIYEITIGLPYYSYNKSCRNAADRLDDSGKWFMSGCESDEYGQIKWLLRTYTGDGVEWLNTIFDQAYPEVVQHRSGRGFDCQSPPDDAVSRRELEEPPINNLEMTCHASPGGFGDYGLLHYTVHIGVKYVAIPSVFPDHPSYNAPSCRNLFMRLHTTGAAFRGFLCHDDGHGATLWHFDADGGSSGTINRLLNEEYPEVVKHMRKKHLGNGFNCPSQADQ